MCKKILSAGLLFLMICSLEACGTTGKQNTVPLDTSENSSYESVEATTREYEIGDFGYWNAGPDLAIFYDDIYEQTIVEVIPLGHAETGAETMAKEAGTVRLELVNKEGDQTENE